MMPPSIVALVDQLRQVADTQGLSRAARLEVVSAIHSAIVPKRTPGKKKDARLDAAYRDQQAGVRRLELNHNYIPGYGTMSRWHRRVEEKKLRDSLAKRAERERKRHVALTIPPGELSA